MSTTTKCITNSEVGGTTDHCDPGDINAEAAAITELLDSNNEVNSGANQRTLDDIITEVLSKKKHVVLTFIDIGNLLNEAKPQVPHGLWGHWLRNSVDFSAREAQLFMRLASEYPNPGLVTDLGVSKSSILLALPSPDREAFMAESHEVNGTEKNIVDMSKRELEFLVREHPKARKSKKGRAKKSKGNLFQPIHSKKYNLSERKADIVSETVIASIIHVEHIQSCIVGLLDSLTGQQGDPETRDELATALRVVCEETLNALRGIPFASEANAEPTPA